MDNQSHSSSGQHNHADFASDSSSSMEISGADEGNFSPRPKGQDKSNLLFLADVPLEVSVELGRIPITIRELLSLKQGSVLELEKLAGEPLEILLNEKLICRGEVIVINEKYGIRMTDIMKPNGEIEINQSPL